MKKFITLAIVTLLSSCAEFNSEEDKYTIVTIDSCEYLEYDSGAFKQRVYSLIHKGNCKYCISRNKK